MSSRFTPVPDAWDLVFATDANDTDPLTLTLVSDDDIAMWEGIDAPALGGDQPVYRERAVLWRPTLGCGISRRTDETTAAGPDGQIVSSGVSYGRNATFVIPGLPMPAGKLTEISLPSVVATTTGRIAQAAEFDINRDLFFTTGGRYLLTIGHGTGDTVVTNDLGAGYRTHSLQVFDDKIYISGGSSGSLFSWDGIGFGGTGATCKAGRMARVNWAPSNAIMGGSGGGTAADHLILVDPTGVGFYHVVSGTDVTNVANWIGKAGAPIPVGAASYPIQDVVASPRVIWFSKPNGLTGFTEIGRAVNLTPWIERAYNPSNGTACEFYSDDQQALVFYAHQQGLVAVTVNGTRQETARFIQFGGRSSNETPIWGRPRAIAPHVDGVFVAYYDGASSYVMRLVLERNGGYRWSGSECTIPDQEVTLLRVTSPEGRPRLWIATVDASGRPHLYWQSLPESGNPWVDFSNGLAHRFATGWDVYLPRDDAGSSAEKVVRRYDAVARNVVDANQVAVDAAADDGAWVEQGAITGGPRASFIATTYQSGGWFNWRLRCQNSEATPLALETFQARMSVLPEQADVWTFKCLLAAGQGIGNGAADTRDPYAIRARIRAFQRAGPIHLRRSPLSRETLVVKLEQGARLQAIKSRKGGELSLVLTITVSVLQTGAIYGADVYSAGEYGADG